MTFLLHNYLKKKIESIGFDNRALNWLKSYLCGRQQCVDMDGTLSDWQTVKLEVPQGSILGPIQGGNCPIYLYR